MAQSAGIQKVGIRHEAILNYLLENPTRSLGETAAHFGITQPWLSCIIHSDAFQSKLRERQDTVFHHTVVATIKDKAALVAHAALDKLADQLANGLVQDPKQLTDTADKILGRLGYGGNNGAQSGVTVNVNNNTVTVDRALLEAARERIGRTRVEVLEVTSPPEGLVDQASAISYTEVEESQGAGGLQVPGLVPVESNR